MRFIENREIEYIILHAADTFPDQDISIVDIDKWHIERGMDMVGYHFFVKLDGTPEVGRILDCVGAHAAPYNTKSIGICYAGGLVERDWGLEHADTRTEAQKQTILELLITLKQIYPNAKIIGHCDVPGVKKPCPCFDAKEEYKHL